MKTTDAINFFGSQKALADILSKTGKRCSAPAVSQWGQEPPKYRQYQIEKITNGKLKVSPGI